MHLSGKIFVVLNALLALVFILCSAPVVKSRIELQQRIDNERKNVRPINPMIPDDGSGLEREVAKINRERVKLQTDIDRVRVEIEFETNRGLTERASLDQKIAVLADRVLDAQAKLNDLKATEHDVQEESQERQKEIERLTAELAAAEKLRDERSSEVAILVDRLVKTLKAFDQNMAGAREKEMELRKRHDQAAPSQSAKLARGR